MTRTSRTELAVLGALSTGPMTGYEVRATITETLGHFWRESYGQIYPTLDALERAGHVRRAGHDTGSRRVAEITPSGRARLRELLAEPVSSPPPRNGTLLRLFFGSLLPPGEARALLEDAGQRADDALGHFARVRAEVSGDDGPEQAFRTMTLSYGEHVARAQLAWARECLGALDALEAALDDEDACGARG